MKIGRVGSLDIRKFLITVRKTPVEKVKAELQFRGPRLLKVNVKSQKLKGKGLIDYRA